MSPHRSRGDEGRFRIDWTVPEPVGRLNISLRADTVREFERRKTVLRKLVEDSQLGVLVALKRGDSTIEALVEADRAGRLKGAGVLSDLKLRANLWTAVEDTLPAMGASKETRRRYRTSFRTLATLSEAGLGRMCEEYARRGRVIWNHLVRKRLEAEFLGAERRAFRGCLCGRMGGDGSTSPSATTHD